MDYTKYAPKTVASVAKTIENNPMEVKTVERKVVSTQEVEKMLTSIVSMAIGNITTVFNSRLDVLAKLVEYNTSKTEDINKAIADVKRDCTLIASKVLLRQSMPEHSDNDKSGQSRAAIDSGKRGNNGNISVDRENVSTNMASKEVDYLAACPKNGLTNELVTGFFSEYKGNNFTEFKEAFLSMLKGYCKAHKLNGCSIVPGVSQSAILEKIYANRNFAIGNITKTDKAVTPCNLPSPTNPGETAKAGLPELSKAQLEEIYRWSNLLKIKAQGKASLFELIYHIRLGDIPLNSEKDGILEDAFSDICTNCFSGKDETSQGSPRDITVYSNEKTLDKFERYLAKFHPEY